MAIPVADDVEFWAHRATCTRVAANTMLDQSCRDRVLAIADSYGRMARIAEVRLARRAAGARKRFGGSLWPR